jgi:hypothetical protein
MFFAKLRQIDCKLKDMAKHWLCPAVQFPGPDRLYPERVAEPDGHPHRLQHHNGNGRHPPTPRQAPAPTLYSGSFEGVARTSFVRGVAKFGVWLG